MADETAMANVRDEDKQLRESSTVFKTAIDNVATRRHSSEDPSESSRSITEKKRENSSLNPLPKDIEKQMGKLLPDRKETLASKLSNRKNLNLVYLARTKPEKEPDEEKDDISKVFAMKKIAKGLISMQQTRQQRLEKTGNVTISHKLRKFEPNVVEEYLKCVLEKHLKKMKYESTKCRAVSKSLSEFIRDELKKMHYPRYKFVTVVSIGQLGKATLIIGSRCVWNKDTDTFACSKFSNESLYALAQVFAIFQE